MKLAHFKEIFVKEQGKKLKEQQQPHRKPQSCSRSGSITSHSSNCTTCAERRKLKAIRNRSGRQQAKQVRNSRSRSQRPNERRISPTIQLKEKPRRKSRERV